MYQNETTNKFSRELALEHVLLQLNTDDDRTYYFEIQTEQNIYYCGCKRSRNRVRLKFISLKKKPRFLPSFSRDMI
jgi:hypothetical protein